MALHVETLCGPPFQFRHFRRCWAWRFGRCKHGTLRWHRRFEGAHHALRAGCGPKTPGEY
eukprot:15479353-Alexandrium_andersonii.AAC.1